MVMRLLARQGLIGASDAVVTRWVLVALRDSLNMN
jgi:hypothetical protein